VLRLGETAVRPLGSLIGT